MLSLWLDMKASPEVVVLACQGSDFFKSYSLTSVHYLFIHELSQLKTLEEFSNLLTSIVNAALHSNPLTKCVELWFQDVCIKIQLYCEEF